MYSMVQRFLYYIFLNPLRVRCRNGALPYLNTLVCMSSRQGRSPTEARNQEVNMDPLVLNTISSSGPSMFSMDTESSDPFTFKPVVQKYPFKASECFRMRHLVARSVVMCPSSALVWELSSAFASLS